MPSSPARLGRAESQQRTRERLLDAAAQAFREYGYRSASVGAIAAAAGYTVGALYSNFKDKDDLLLALIEREIGAATNRVIAAAAEGKDLMEMLKLGAREWFAFLDEEPELYRLLIEFWTIWVGNPELRPLHAERFALLREVLGIFARDEAEKLGLRLKVPPESAGAAIVALADGLALQRLADPGAIPDDLLASMLGALLPAVTEPLAG